jgi:hypothetical protein
LKIPFPSLLEYVVDPIFNEMLVMLNEMIASFWSVIFADKVTPEWMVCDVSGALVARMGIICFGGVSGFALLPILVASPAALMEREVCFDELATAV